MITIALVIVAFLIVGWWYGTLAAVCVWLTGWIVFLLFALIPKRFGRGNWLAGRSASDSDRKGYLLGIACRLLFSLVMWPFFLIGFCEDLWEAWVPRLAVAIGLRPAWSLPNDGEETDRTWTLQDGTEFSASVLGYGKEAPADISAFMEAGTVEYRTRMVAPEQRAATRWRAMKRLTPEEYADQTEEEEDLYRTPPFESKLELEPGKYAIEFRVEKSDRQAEEISGLTLIVY